MSDGKNDIPKPKSEDNAAEKQEEAVPASLGLIQGIRVLIGKGFATVFFSRRSKLRARLCAGLSVFFIAAGGIPAHRIPPWVGISLVGFGLLWLAPGVWQFAVNNGATNKFANVCSGLVFFLVVLGTASVLRHEYLPAPKRHLKLYAHTSDAPDEILNLTSNVLFVKMSKDSFRFPPNLPFLDVEVAQNEPQFTLKFGIFNDSAPRFSRPEFDVERPEIAIWIPNADPGDSLKWTADPKWERVTSEGKTTNGATVAFPGRILRYQFPSALAAGVGDSAPGMTFNMQEKPGGLSVAVVTGGDNVDPVVYCFKLLAEPSNETNSKMRFDTNSTIWWKWKYRPVAYLPIDTPIVVSPNRIQLSDGNTTLGTRVDISNPSSNNLYAITFSIEMERGVVPISSAQIELSKADAKENSDRGGLQNTFESRMDVIGGAEMRLFTIPVLLANGHRSLWIRGTILTNSFADVSVWQVLNSFPEIKYTTNGIWRWPVLSSNSPFWMHTGWQPMDFDWGIAEWVGTNGFTNDNQIIPSRP